jgi:hypothetical protein
VKAYTSTPNPEDAGERRFAAAAPSEASTPNPEDAAERRFAAAAPSAGDPRSAWLAEQSRQHTAAPPGELTLVHPQHLADIGR